MEIIKRLIVNGGQEVNAVLLRDGNEEYPVFLESLRNTVIFPELVKSGYKLESLPYGFYREGLTRFNDLDIEHITLPESDIERMHFSIGAKMPESEISKHLVANSSVAPTYRFEPNYTILTRDDFIKYLELISTVDVEDDFLPINYFVAPEARFDISVFNPQTAEYHTSDYQKYIDILDNRRIFSFAKFKKLLAWLRQNAGLGANYTVQEVLDCYFQWGVDGCNAVVTSRPMHQDYSQILTSSGNGSTYYSMCNGLMTMDGSILLPPDKQGQGYSTKIDHISMSDVPNGANCGIITLSKPSTQPLSIVSLENGVSFRYTNSDLVLLRRRYRTLSIRSPFDISKILPITYAFEGNEYMLEDQAKLDSLTRFMYNHIKSKVSVSSFNLLQKFGADPIESVLFIHNSYGKTEHSKGLDKESSAVDISYGDVEAFFNMQMDNISEAQAEYITSIVNGEVNADHIQAANEAEWTHSQSVAEKTIKVIHDILGHSYDDIYNKIKNVETGVVPFSNANGQVTYTIDMTPLTFVENGYKTDLVHYVKSSAEDCMLFGYVTNVAREVGEYGTSQEDDGRARRDVGLEFKAVYRYDNKTKLVWNELSELYDKRVDAHAKDQNTREQLMAMKTVFLRTQYFRIYFQGVIGWLKALGGDVEDLRQTHNDLYTKLLATVQDRIESTLVITHDMVDFTEYPAKFRYFFVNAYVTDQYVIPKPGYKINEKPFQALWEDYSSIPQIHAALIEHGVITPQFVPWSYRYHDQALLKREEAHMGQEYVPNTGTYKNVFIPSEYLTNVNSLERYASRIFSELEDYPADRDYISIHHPVEDAYPYLYQEYVDYENRELLAAPRTTGTPKPKVGQLRVRTEKDFEFTKAIRDCDTEPTQYVKPFNGFQYEVLANVQSLANVIPVNSSDPDAVHLLVHQNSQTIFRTDTNTVESFTQLPTWDLSKYPIKQVFGNTYLLCDVNNKLWEVRV